MISDMQSTSFVLQKKFFREYLEFDSRCVQPMSKIEILDVNSTTDYQQELINNPLLKVGQPIGHCFCKPTWR